MRCVFSVVGLMGQTLRGGSAGAPPGTVHPRLAVWRAVVRVLRSTPRMLLDDLVTTLFPADCRCCAGPLTEAGPVPVCGACVGRAMRRSELHGCSRCGEALDLGSFSDIDLDDVRFARLLPEGLLCHECRLAPPEFDRAVSHATYNGELRTLIQLLKFDGVPAAANLLGDLLAEVILQLEGQAGGELLVVAVPLHRRRERQRGYNQSVLLARRAVRALRRIRSDWRLIEAYDALERQRSTEAQYELSRKGRRRNLRGAFRVAGDVRGREVLLVDDILTSGATARECARVLKARRERPRFGWRRSARAQRPQVELWDAAARCGRPWVLR